jgi:predicted dehydrogenase
MNTRSLSRRQWLAVSAVGALTLHGRAAGEPLRAGQIGVRHAHAAGKLEALRRLRGHYSVVGWAEADDTAATAAGRRAPYAGLPRLAEAELLADPELRVVTVETDLAEATATARRAVQAGKHVHLDKPGGADHAAFAALRREAEAAGKWVQMGYMLRYNPAFQLLFHAAREGWLGEIREISASMGKRADAGLRRDLAAHPGHGMFELACHLVDAVVTLLGEPQAVQSFATASRSPDDALPDHQLAVLTYPRSLVTLRCNHDDPFGFPRRAFAVAGTAGTFEIAPLESGRISLRLARAQGEYPAGESTHTLPVPAGRYDGEFLDLAACVRGETRLAWNADHDIATHRTALRAAGVAVPP